jgi:uncharacterized protein YggE
VTERLNAEGVEDAAMETSNVSVYPIRTYDPKTGKESLTGYRSQNTVTVTLKDGRNVGKVLAASVGRVRSMCLGRSGDWRKIARQSPRL